MLENSDGLSQCEIWTVIKLLNKEQVDKREIHRRFCAVYGEDNVMAPHNVHRQKCLTVGE